MGRKIVVSFPGGRGYEIPLLYFGAKLYEDKGYEKLFISHPWNGDYDFSALLENAEKVIHEVKFDEYDDIVFVAKSIGTVVACQIKEKYQIPAALILFTPLYETMPYIHHGNDIKLVAVGDKDRYIDALMLSAECEKEGILCHVEQNVGHRMEVLNDLNRNLEIVANVISKLS